MIKGISSILWESLGLTKSQGVVHSFAEELHV